MYDLNIREVAEIVAGTLRLGAMPPLGGTCEPFGRIVTDVNRVTRGSVFWPVCDGDASRAEHAELAFAQGAAGAVVSGRRLEPWAGTFSIQVEDSRQALLKLADWKCSLDCTNVIWVSGAVAKTAAARMVHQVLKSRLSGKLDEQLPADAISVAQAILEPLADRDYHILEVDDQGDEEIDALLHLCRPQIGVITSLHLSHESSPSATARRLARLLGALPPHGWAVLNGDSPHLNRLDAGLPATAIRVGRSAHCDVVARNVRCGEGQFECEIGGQAVRVPAWGRHHVHAVLAAYVVGRIMDLQPEQIALALAQFQAPPGRCQILQGPLVTIIDDTDRGSTATIEVALELLRDHPSAGRRVVVCGELAVSGEMAGKENQRVGDQVVTVCGAERMVAYGPYAAELARGAREAGMPQRDITVCRSAEELPPVMKSVTAPGDTILLSGRHSMVLDNVLASLLGQEKRKTAA